MFHSIIEGMGALSNMSSFVFPGNKVSFHDYHKDNELLRKLLRRGFGPIKSGTLLLVYLLPILFQQTDNPLVWTIMLCAHGLSVFSMVIVPVFILKETSVADYDLCAPDTRGMCTYHLLMMVFCAYSLLAPMDPNYQIQLPFAALEVASCLA